MSERKARALTCILQALGHDANFTPGLGAVATRLLTTAGQVVLRFSQCAECPARAGLMSRARNPATYYQEVLRFLRVDARALDSGVCAPLRREAWDAAGRCSGLQTDAIAQPLAARAGGACHDRYGHRAVDLGRRTQTQPRQAHRISPRFICGKSITGWIREALANRAARRSANCKGAQGATRRQVRKQGFRCASKTARALPSITGKVALGRSV